jgi:hypothetical protein
MIVRLITPLTNSSNRNNLFVISIDNNNNVVLNNIIENVAGASPQNNPDLYRQLWERTMVNSTTAVFKNLYTETYLSCKNGSGNSTQLTLDENNTNTSSNWILTKQNNMPNDDQGAPRSYSIGALGNSSQVIDLSGASTTPGRVIQMYSWKGQPPYDNNYNQFWFLEEPRIVINNPTGNQTLIQSSNHGQEVIEAWDSMVGGNLLGTLNPNQSGMYINGAYSTFYLSSKRNGNNGQRVNESENEVNQVINLSNDSSASVQFYYGDPLKGASVIISTSS